MTTPYGQELLITGLLAQPPTEARAHEVLTLCRDSLGMTEKGRLMGEYDGTIGAIMLIVQSHIALHLSPPPAFSYLTVFSCKPFDSEQITACLAGWLDMRILLSDTIDRSHDPRRSATEASVSHQFGATAVYDGRPYIVSR